MSCTCHINPPCSFCTSHVECDICGQRVLEEIAERFVDRSDGSSIYLCPACVVADI